MGHWFRRLLTANLNILVIPESGAEITSFRLRRRAARSLLIVAAALAVVVLASVAMTFHAYRQSVELARASRQNATLRRELEDLSSAVEVLRQSVARNDAYEDRALALAGIHEQDELPPPMGRGGSDGITSLITALGDDTLESLLLDVEVSVDSLIGAAESQGQGYKRAIEVLEQRKKSLDHIPSIHPLGGAGWFSSGFGHRKDPFTGRRTFHAGLDISAAAGTSILATADGVVTKSGREGFFGNMITIDHGNGIETVYGHNSENLVRQGEKVKRGQIIASVGATGRATAPHLHYTVRVDGKTVNPYRYILPEDVVVD